MNTDIRNNPDTPSQRFAIDIGSTVIKFAKIGERDNILEQTFYPRDMELGIAKQVESILAERAIPAHDGEILVCSSANGGLRVGIICLSKLFSGAVARNQVLSAGANPLYLHDFDEEGGSLRYVDMLLVCGGIDCPDAAPLAAKLDHLDLGKYKFGSLVYAGNKYLAERFVNKHPAAVVIDNSLAEDLAGRSSSVFEAVRHAYLDDLVYKEGVSELGGNLSMAIRPTPEVVNRGFQRAVFNCSDVEIAGSCVLIDIGGATTDLHYTVEIIRNDSPARPSHGASIARYVFTDLGIVASVDSTLLQMRTNPRIYEFLCVVLEEDVRETYRMLSEGEYEPSPRILTYACLFLSLDRFAQGRGAGLPVADLGKVSQIVLTGGASLTMDLDTAARIVDLFISASGSKPRLYIDHDYRFWVDGITWTGGSELSVC